MSATHRRQGFRTCQTHPRSLATCHEAGRLVASALMKILRAFAPPRWRLLRDLVRALAASGLVAGASAQLSVGGAGTGVIKFEGRPTRKRVSVYPAAS